MKFARIQKHIFANPENLCEWFILKVRGYKRHHTPIGKCYIKNARK